MWNISHQNFSTARIIPVILLLLFTGCLGPVKKLHPENKRQRPVSVYIISHGWHVGLAFEDEHLRAKLPANEKLPKGKLWFISWGDNKYYPSENVRIDLFLRAAFLPTGSVIHLARVDRNLNSYFQNSDIVRIQVSEKGMKELTGYLSDQFEYNSEGELQFFEEGLYANSAFFEARGLYFFPRTSNKWTARALRKSGFPITPFYAIISGNVMQQARKSGEVIQRR